MVVQSDSHKHVCFAKKRFAVLCRGFVVALGAIGLTACMSQINAPPSSWYAQMGALENKGDTLYICHGFGCEYRTPVTFSQQDKRRLHQILQRGSGSPEAERAALSDAVQWQERRVGPVVGSSNDIGGLDMVHSKVRGQMDCLDEATNTTSLLTYLSSQGWLKYHRVTRPASRGFFLDLKYPHASAVVVDTTTGTPWVVDSWRLSNGEPPDILPLSKWMGMTSADLE